MFRLLDAKKLASRCMTIRKRHTGQRYASARLVFFVIAGCRHELVIVLLLLNLGGTLDGAEHDEEEADGDATEDWNHEDHLDRVQNE